MHATTTIKLVEKIKELEHQVKELNIKKTYITERYTQQTKILNSLTCKWVTVTMFKNPILNHTLTPLIDCTCFIIRFLIMSNNISIMLFQLRALNSTKPKWAVVNTSGGGTAVLHHAHVFHHAHLSCALLCHHSHFVIMITFFPCIFTMLSVSPRAILHTISAYFFIVLTLSQWSLFHPIHPVHLFIHLFHRAHFFSHMLIFSFNMMPTFSLCSFF